MDRTEFHAFGDSIVAFSQVLVKRFNPLNGISVSSSVDLPAELLRITRAFNEHFSCSTQT